MLNWHFKIRTVYNKQNQSILIRPIYLGQAKNKMVTLKHIEFGSHNVQLELTAQRVCQEQRSFFKKDLD